MGMHGMELSCHFLLGYSRHVLEVEATVKLGDVLTLLGCTFQDSTFELGVEYYQKAHNMKSSSYKELRKFGLHLNKQSELLSHSFFMHPSIDDLDELCNFCFVKSIIVKPAYLTRIMYMEVLTSRLQRTHSIYAIVELMDLVTQTALKGLDANSEKLDIIIKWASFLDHLITFYVPYYTFVEQSFKVCYYQFILSYRKVLMEKDLKREEINLEPLIAFSLVERIDYVHENAFDILISLSKSENSDLKNDAIKHVNHIKNIYKYRTKEVESNKKKISSYLKGLKDKTQIALWKKSHLTINDVSHDYNLFYTCMNTCNAKRDTRKYKNPYEEEFKELVTQKNPFGGDYIMGSLIKETARTSVYTVESAGGKSFAMKVISATKSSIEFIMAMREIINLKKLSHPNIVKYSNAYYFSDQFFIVLEYCNAGNIMEMYKEVKLSVSDISFVMRELCQGVSYLHENNIAHLSITTENMLLIGDGSFKIGGFGTVMNWTKDEIDKETIRLAVRSPEMLQGKVVNGKADVFALGVFCLELASRTRWNSQIKSDFQAEFLIGSCIIPEIISVNNTIDKSTKLMLDFISMAMHPNPMKRPTSAQLLRVSINFSNQDH